MLGAITDDIYGDKYDEIVDVLRKGESNLPQAVGIKGAELLFDEVMAAMDQGNGDLQ